MIVRRETRNMEQLGQPPGAKCASVLGMTLLSIACAGRSTSNAPTQGQGGADVAGGSGESAGAGMTAGGSGGIGGATDGAAGSVDAYGACPLGLEYFMSLRGDLPERRVTSSCATEQKVSTVPVYNHLHGLDPGEEPRPALIVSNGTEWREVWRFPPPAALLSTAGFYMSPDGTTYSTCGTSRDVHD